MPFVDTSLKNRTIVVTGAGSGIGKGVALYLAEQGARLALTDKSDSALRAVCTEINKTHPEVEVVSALADVTSEEAVKEAVAQFAQKLGRLDGLANCAGINLPSPLCHELSWDLFASHLDVNMKGTFLFCKYFAAQAMEREEGAEVPEGGFAVVNVGSNSSVMGMTNLTAYCASKHAVLGFSRAMAKEYATRNMRVNVVAPGPIDTPMLHSFSPSSSDPSFVQSIADGLPMKRIGEPEEVARVVGFLLGSGATYTTGAIVPIDGGWTA
ncbi:hypothetical protein JCM8547_007102 [Rhodosporidiobolus lusitaniae]